MSKLEALKNHLSTITDFAHISSIMQSETRSDFLIIDHEGQSYIIIDNDFDKYTIHTQGAYKTVNGFDETKLFHIINVKFIIFIPIDGKNGLLGYGDSHCDCVLFDENDFCFIEFKLNAISIEERAIRKNRSKAIYQLSKTIDLFDTKLEKNYQGLNLEAYVCSPQSYPRDDASWKSISVAFLEKYGISLFETNEKICK